jgi:hypothetical protein
MPGYTRMPKGSAGGHNAASILWLPRPVRLYCPAQMSDLPRHLGRSVCSLTRWPVVRTSAGHLIKRAEWCNTALLIYASRK